MSDPSACISRCRGDDHTKTIYLYERVSETEPREEKLLMLLLLAAVAC